MAQLKLFLFGPPRLERNDETLTTRRRKPLALLIYLTVTGQSHSRDALATLLWPDFSQSQARANLRRELSRLNKILDENLLVIDRDNIGFNHQSDLWLDIEQFQRELAETQGHNHPQNRICANCMPALTEAVSLYTDDFLAGFSLLDCPAFDEWQFFQTEGLRQDLASALERLTRGYSSQGEFEAAIPHARRWLSLDPLHEPAHQQMMRLYAWAGRESAAFKQYQECVRIFEEELGMPPSKETTMLHETIKAKRLTPPAKAEEPLESAQDRQGSVTSFMGVEEELSPQSLSRPAPIHNLPTQPTPLIGRESELASLDTLLKNPDVRLVSIVGPGGMGKTRLSLAAGEAAVGHFPDGVFFIPLAPVQSADKIILALAEQLGFIFHGDTEPEKQILEFLRSQRLLLIFDNFEHVLAGASFVAAILQQAPQVNVIVTSRERLNIAGEAVFRLGGLSYPDNDRTDPIATEQTEAEHGALNLFLHRARLIRPDFRLEQRTLTQVTRICKLVQGMPLAIILAVSWIETLSLDELAETIASSVDILASEQRDLPLRQRSIRAAFETSWQRLTPTEQLVFAKLSVFRGSFNRKAAETVAGATMFVLRTLIEKSLLMPIGPDRYELHELLRQFAEERLEETGQAKQVQQAHGQHYLDKLNALESDLKGRRQIEALNEIKADLSNIQLAWFWALADLQFSLIDAALEALTVFCFYAMRANEGDALYKAAYQKLEAEHAERILGRLLARHAWLRSEYGLETDSIKADLTQSLRIAEKFSDEREIALTLLARGYYLTRILGKRSTALVEYEQALQIYRAFGDRFYMAILLGRIGFCRDDNLTLFSDFTRQSLELALETGNECEAVWAQGNLGGVAVAGGDSTSGQRDLWQTLARVDKIGVPSRGYFASNAVALAGFLQGDLAQTRRYLPPQAQMVKGKVNPITIAYASATRGLYTAVNGELEMAEQLARHSLDFSGNHESVLLARWALAMVCVDQTNLTEAGQHLTYAYQIPKLSSAPGVMTRSLPVAAYLLARHNQPERAVQILALAQKHPASQVGWLRHWSHGASLRSELEQTLDTAAFKAAWKQGQSLDLAETIVHLVSELSG